VAARPRIERFGHGPASLRFRHNSHFSEIEPLPLLLYTFEACRFALRALVLLMSVHFIASTVLFLRARRKPTAPPAPPTAWPRVTVQLPMRNEYFTAARAIEAAAALDYPKECLEIQILDDSDDDTLSVVHEEVVRYRTAGFEVVQLRRYYPTHYKAGALAGGLARANGEFIAIFDADFVPPSDFLKRAIPYFDDPAVGLVQGRWEHLNRTASWFTRLQAQILDGLMVVEQTAKSHARLPFQFNGSAGVWRKSAIEKAGGWTFDSLTEDFDLSMRAQMAGFRLVHLPDLAVPCELPTTLGLFRVQQRRWALGTAQLLRKRLGRVLGSPMSVAERLSLVTQLGRHFGYPLILLMVLTVPLTTFGYLETPFDSGVLNPVILGVAVLSVTFQQAVAERVVGRSASRAILLAPLSIFLAIGLAATYTAALSYGLRDRAGAFHRTPKVPRPPSAAEPDYRAERSILVVFEVLVGIAYAAFTALAVMRGLFPEAGFLALVAASYLWVGVGSMHVAAFSPARSERHAKKADPSLARKSEDRLPADSVPKT
jgi:cellulose synthase/poly-beta-1,6-N-acetylglucosamine synthase-like glycosyltransferase